MTGVMTKKAYRKNIVPSLSINTSWVLLAVLLVLIAISWQVGVRHISQHASQSLSEDGSHRSVYTVLINRQNAAPTPGEVILDASGIAGGARLQLIKHVAYDSVEPAKVPERYPVLNETDKLGTAEMSFLVVKFLFGQFVYVTLAMIAMVLWVQSKIDDRPLRKQLKSRQSRIFLGLYCIAVIAAVKWHVSLTFFQLLAYGLFSTVVTVYMYRYIASGVPSFRPKIFLWASIVCSGAFLLFSDTVGIKEICVGALFVATALWLCELVTRGQYRQKDKLQALNKYDWRAIVFGCFLLLAWRDAISIQYIDSQAYQQMSALLRVVLMPVLWFPLAWAPILVFLLKALVENHKKKLETLNIYNEKLLKSIQERELQINLAYYDDLQRQEREAIEAERQNIYRDLHDGIGSRLVAAMYSLRSGRTTKAALENALLSCLTDIKRIMHADDLQDHRSIQDLFFDYCFTMDDLLSESGVTFEYKIPSEQEFYMLGKASGTLIKMSQEIVTNALKHSPARSIYVELILGDADLSVCVREYNYDFDSLDAFGQAKTISSGAGLGNLKLRALEIGAEFHYEQRSDQRTSRIDMKLFDPDLVYLPDKVHFDPERRRQFLISKIGDLS